MKKIYLLSITIVLFLTSSVQAQHDVNINAIGLFFKNYGLGYEYVINDEMGAGASFNYVNGLWFGDLGTDISYSSFNIAPEFRFYFNPSDGADGFYFGGYAKYQTSTWGGNTGYDSNNNAVKYDYTFNGLALGMQTGKKWVTNSGFYFETLFGMGRFLTTSWSSTNPNFNPSDDFENSSWYTWDFRFALNIGWRFGGY